MLWKTLGLLQHGCRVSAYMRPLQITPYVYRGYIVRHSSECEMVSATRSRLKVIIDPCFRKCDTAHVTSTKLTHHSAHEEDEEQQEGRHDKTGLVSSGPGNGSEARREKYRRGLSSESEIPIDAFKSTLMT